MEEIAISEFKAKCSAILENVRRTRMPVRVTRFGKPVAEIVPPTAVLDRAKWIGSMKDSTEILGDIISPANDEDEWNSLRD
jgi:prevent-host-death family protein